MEHGNRQPHPQQFHFLPLIHFRPIMVYIQATQRLRRADHSLRYIKTPMIQSVLALR